jgi:hypothetical protein
MKDLQRRLRCLEVRRERASLASTGMRHFVARLEAARRRCGLTAPSPERQAQLAGQSVAQILQAGRLRARLAARGALP